MDGISKDFDELPEGDIPHYISVNATSLLFPEKLMYLMLFMEREFSQFNKQPSEAPITWDSEGKVVTIQNVQELEKTWLPRFFSTNAKFSSFTRKLYRWGFRRVVANWHTRERNDNGQHPNVQGVKDKTKCKLLCFHHDNFRRDDKQLLYRMQSLTPEKARRNQAKEYNRVLRLKEQEACAAPQVYPVVATSLASGYLANFPNSAPVAAQPQPTAQQATNGGSGPCFNMLTNPRLFWELQNNYMACQYLLAFNNPTIAASLHMEPTRPSREIAQPPATREQPMRASPQDLLPRPPAMSNQVPQQEITRNPDINLSVASSDPSQSLTKNIEDTSKSGSPKSNA